VYLLGVLGAGLYFSRQQTKSEDYFVGGRKMPWLAVGLSIMASLLSTLSYLASPGEMIKNGPAMAIGWLVVPFVFLVVSFLWLPFLMRLKLTSVYEYLDRRFGPRAGKLASCLFVFVLRLFWMGLIVMTASEAVADITYESITGFVGSGLSRESWTLAVLFSVGILATVYTVLGGIKAVIWTDVVQTIILILGALLTLIIIASDTGTGPTDWWATITSDEGGGHAMPPLWSWDLGERNVIGFALLNSVFWYCCTFLGDQVAMQRYFSTESLSAAIKSNIVNFSCDLIVMVLLAGCGMALLSYYLQDPAKVDPLRVHIPVIENVDAFERLPDAQKKLELKKARAAWKNRSSKDVLSHENVADKVFPHFIGNGLPVGLSGLVVAALFAVAMSSLDSGINSVSTVLTVDFFRKRRPNMSDAEELRLARKLSIGIGFGCTLLAVGLMFLPDHFNIIDVSSRTFNCALGPLAAMFLVGMFLPHVGETAVIVATLAGTALALIISWWTEILYVLQLTGADTLEEAIKTVAHPGTFLITPMAATSTFLLAALLGALMKPPDLEAGRKLGWWAVVKEGSQDD